MNSVFPFDYVSFLNFILRWNLFGEQGGGNVFNVYKSLGLQDIYLFQECRDFNHFKNGLGFGSSMGTKQFGSEHAIAWNGNRFRKLDDGYHWVGRDQIVQGWDPNRFLSYVRLQHKATGKTFFVANHHGPLNIDTGGLFGPDSVASKINDTINRFKTKW